MEILLQYFDNCPNWKITDRHLRALIDEHALEATVHYQVIDTPEAAAEYGFRGSPTVLIDGADPFANSDAAVGLSCRVHATENGPAGSPAVEQLQRALAAAQTED